MVRHYKKKGVYKDIKPEVREAAVDAVKSKLMSLRNASQEFGIPRSTLFNWVHGKVRTLKSIISAQKQDKSLLFFFKMFRILWRIILAWLGTSQMPLRGKKRQKTFRFSIRFL